MTSVMKIFVGLLAVGIVAGCTTFTAAPPEKKQEIGGVLRVTPTVLWSATGSGDTQVWTINGMGLEAITFFTNIEDGQAIAPHLQGENAPKFSQDMTVTDVVDLYESVLAAREYAQIEVSNLKPLKISGQDAFRFEYSAFNSVGLSKKAIVVGLIDEAKGLNLVVYEAATEHYYEASRKSAEEILQSLEKI